MMRPECAPCLDNPQDSLADVAAHRHVLIVDDNQKIHNDFFKVLNPALSSSGLLNAEAELFGAPLSTRAASRFHMDSALGGEAALQALLRHSEQGHRYSVAFVDVRMPPGWDGLRTTQELWRRDPDVQVVLCTAYSDCSWDTMVEQLGAGDNFLILKKPFDVIEARQIAQALSEKWKALRDNETHLQRLESQVADRTRQLEETCAQLKREMAERSALEVELRRAQKLEAVGRLAAGIGHEINNPLAYVLCNLEHVEHRIEEMRCGTRLARPESLIPPLRDATMGAERIKQIVETTREFARPIEGDLMHVHVDGVIASARRMVDHELSHRATVTETLADTPAVAADPHRLEQVLVNLMLNASQAFEDNQSKRQIQIWTAHPTPGEVVIGVRDTGRGISAENIERIFDPFFSTRPNGRGTGLGLWISRDIVRSFGGQLELQSELGVGTTVTAVLKVADSQHLQPTDPSKQAPRQLGPIAASCRARVLLVDDEPAVLRGLRRRLSVHDVMTAHSVEEAVQTYRDNPFDIVFCDLMMPDSDGMDFYRILDEMGPEHSRRIVMMTGGVFSDRLQRELAKLPNPCIRKPFNDGDIETLIVESLL